MYVCMCVYIYTHVLIHTHTHSAWFCVSIWTVDDAKFTPTKHLTPPPHRRPYEGQSLYLLAYKLCRHLGQNAIYIYIYTYIYIHIYIYVAPDSAFWFGHEGQTLYYIYLSIYLSIYPSIYLSVHRPYEGQSLYSLAYKLCRHLGQNAMTDWLAAAEAERSAELAAAGLHIGESAGVASAYDRHLVRSGWYMFIDT